MKKNKNKEVNSITQYVLNTINNKNNLTDYLNKYYKSEISVKPNGNFIKIVKNNTNKQYLANISKLYP